MPLYEYRCRRNHTTEQFRKYEVCRRPTVCALCNEPAELVPSLVSKTANRWGDTQWDGKVDRGLGVTLRDRRHREQLMAARGLREAEEGEVEAEQSRVTAQHDQDNKNMKTYQRVLEDTGSSSLAMAQTFPDVEV